MIDVLGRILTEIRDDSAVAAITTRIRGGEPAPGDAKGPGEWLPFVVLAELGRQRERSLPVQEVRILARCYAATYQSAATLAGAVSDAVHATGPRVSASGIGIYGSFDDAGQGSGLDPDTGQPHSDLTIVVYATTELVTP